MKAVIRRVGGITMVGKASTGHWIPMDGPAELGGMDAGSRPLELFLIGLGGCTGMDVLSILSKKRVKLDDFEVTLDADRAEEHPKVFTSIRMTFHFYGEDLKEADLKSAVELSESKYCSASAMLRHSVPIEVKIEIHPPRPAR